MRLFIVMSLSIAALASAELVFSTNSGKPVLSWEAVDGAWDHMELRGSSLPFEADSHPKGALLARLMPEGNSCAFPTSINLAGSFVVEPDICIGCGICVQICPVGAIELVDGKAQIDPETCIACGLCASACPVGSIFAPAATAHFALYGVDPEGAATLLESL